MADNAEQLARSEEVPLYRAEKALNLENDDYEQARKRLREAPVAIKGRFASQNNDIYGLFLITLNINPPNLKSMDVLVGNHRGIGNVKLSLSHDEFSDAIDRLIHEKGKMTALTDQLIEGLQKEFSPPSTEWLELIKDREELSLQDKLDEEIAQFIDEEELLTTVSLESGLVGEGDDDGSAEDSSSDQSGGSGPDETGGVEIVCDVRVSPVRGRPVADIEIGEKIYVTVKDGQKNEHKKLINVIERLEDDAVGMIPAPVKDISRTKTGKLEFIAQFGENVTGRVVAGEDMNILTPASVSSASDDSLLDSVLTWIFLFIVIMVIGLSALYVILMPGG